MQLALETMSLHSVRRRLQRQHVFGSREPKCQFLAIFITQSGRFRMEPIDTVRIVQACGFLSRSLALSQGSTFQTGRRRGLSSAQVRLEAAERRRL